MAGGTRDSTNPYAVDIATEEMVAKMGQKEEEVDPERAKFEETLGKFMMAAASEAGLFGRLKWDGSNQKLTQKFIQDGLSIEQKLKSAPDKQARQEIAIEFYKSQA